jgi:Family of unknown function (DUF6223)
MGYGQNKTYETNLRSYSRRPGCSRPVRGACACRAGGRARFGASRHHGLRPDPRRLWATTVAVLALIGVVIGGLALRRSAGRIGTGNGRMGAIVALVAGLIAVVNGGLNLAIATGGPGTGNGVVGGAAALVLGLIAMALGGLALARSRRTG